MMMDMDILMTLRLVVRAAVVDCSTPTLLRAAGEYWPLCGRSAALRPGWSAGGRASDLRDVTK